MGNLKSSIKFMSANNEFLADQNMGRYDRALARQRAAFKYFLKEVPERIEAA